MKPIRLSLIPPRDVLQKKSEASAQRDPDRFSEEL